MAGILPVKAWQAARSIARLANWAVSMSNCVQMFSLALLLLLQGLPTGTASDYAIPQVFRIAGKVVVGLDEPVMAVVTLKNASGAAQSTQSFSNGTFRFDNVPLGTYWIGIADPRFNLFEDQLLLREAADTGKELTVRLTRLGESPGLPDLDSTLYVIDVETIKTMPAQAMEDFNKGVNALRNRARNNPPDVHFKRAISAAPRFYEAHLQLGLELQRQKKSGDAIQTLETASALKPAEPRPLSELGRLYWEAEQFQKTVEILTKLIALGKMGPIDSYHMGSALYRLNRLDKAEQHLLAAINTGNDTDPAPFLQLHNVFMKMNQPTPALAVLEDYLKLFTSDPGHAAMSERAGQIRQRLGLPPRK